MGRRVAVGMGGLEEDAGSRGSAGLGRDPDSVQCPAA